jgi:hypothetical protein
VREKSCKELDTIAIKSFTLFVLLGAAHRSMAQDAAARYPKMAPISQYVMRDKDAAPDSISRDADVLIHPMESAAMCHMISKRGYGGDSAPHWPSHLMFFYSDTSSSFKRKSGQMAPKIIRRRLTYIPGATERSSIGGHE